MHRLKILLLLGEVVSANACAPFDHEDSICFNQVECSAVLVTREDGISELVCAKASEYPGSCEPEVNDLSERMGICVGLSADDEENHYCEIFHNQESCLVEELGKCQWSQHCMGVENYCDSPEICVTYEGCYHDETSGECMVDRQKSYYVTKWSAAGVIFIVSVAALLLPLVTKELFVKAFLFLEPFLQSSSCGFLLGIAVIHLLSEGSLYATMGGLTLSENNSASPHWITFACTLIGSLMLNTIFMIMTKDSHSHGVTTMIAKTQTESNAESMRLSWYRRDALAIWTSIERLSRFETQAVIPSLEKDRSDVTSASTREKEDETTSMNSFRNFVRSAIKFSGLIVHGAQEGLVVGMQSEELTWILTAVLLFHKILFTLSIGIQLKDSQSRIDYPLSVAFLLSTPISLLAGAYFVSDVNDNVFAHLNAFSGALVFTFGMETLLLLPGSIDAYQAYRVALKEYPPPLEKSSSASRKNYATSPDEDSSYSMSDDVEKQTDNEDVSTEVVAETQSSLERMSNPVVLSARGSPSPTLINANNLNEISHKDFYWKTLQYTLHYLVILVSIVVVLGLMVWHLSVHDHEHGSEESGSEHEHNH